MLKIPDMRSSRFQSLTRLGPIPGFITLGAISNLPKFHAFITNLNNSAFFWSITARLTWRKERKDRKAGENAWLERHERQIALAIHNSGQNSALLSFLSDRYSKLSSISTAKPHKLLRIREQSHTASS